MFENPNKSFFSPNRLIYQAPGENPTRGPIVPPSLPVTPSTPGAIASTAKEILTPVGEGVKTVFTIAADTLKIGNEVLNYTFNGVKGVAFEFKDWMNERVDMPEYKELQNFFIKDSAGNELSGISGEEFDPVVCEIAGFDIMVASLQLRMKQFKLFYGEMAAEENALENVDNISIKTKDERSLEAEVNRLTVAVASDPIGEDAKDRLKEKQAELDEVRSVNPIQKRRPMPTFRKVKFPPGYGKMIGQVYLDGNNLQELDIDKYKVFLKGFLVWYRDRIKMFEKEIKKIGYWKAKAMQNAKIDEDQKARIEENNLIIRGIVENPPKNLLPDELKVDGKAAKVPYKSLIKKTK